MRNLYFSYAWIWVFFSGFHFDQALADSAPKPLPLPHPEHEKYDAGLGRSDALQMIKEGKITILGVGISPPCQYLLKQNLYRKYGIKWAVITDAASVDFENYREAFNEKMINYVIKKRGKNFFIDLEKDVSREEKKRCSEH